MRIIAGKYRARKLTAPDGMTTRPTSDRAREAVFNVLDSRLRKNGSGWNDLTVLDVFAGTGALGLEALSRGAKALFAAEKIRPPCGVFTKMPIRLSKTVFPFVCSRTR